MTEIYLAGFGFLTLLVTNLFQYLKQKKVEDKIIKSINDKNKKQDENINKLTGMTQSMFDYIEHKKYTDRLCNDLHISEETITDVNRIDNTELDTLLSVMIDKYNIVVLWMLNMPHSNLTEENVKRKLIVFAKLLRRGVDFSKIDVIDHDCFQKRLKNEVALININIFTKRLVGEVLNEENKFNGTFEAITKDTLKSLLSDTIKLYRDCKKKV